MHRSKDFMREDQWEDVMKTDFSEDDALYRKIKIHESSSLSERHGSTGFTRELLELRKSKP